ncbi:hypothetical protein ACQPWW_21885 [Micromonospora sp. CA-240977]
MSTAPARIPSAATEAAIAGAPRGFQLTNRPSDEVAPTCLN